MPTITSEAMKAEHAAGRADAIQHDPQFLLVPSNAGRPSPLVAVAEALDVERLVEQVVDTCLSLVFDGQRDDATFRERLRASVLQNAYALRDVMAGRAELDGVRLDDVLEFATVQARLRIPQKSMQRSYRVSFYVQLQVWSRALREQLAAEGTGVDEALDSLQLMTRILLAYQDHVASQVAETYTRDYEALNRSRAHVRRHLIQEVLRGNDDPLAPADRAILNYPLDRTHVAVLLPDVAEGAADRLAEGLRVAARAQHALVYPVTLTGTVVWLARIDPWHEVALASLLEQLERLGVTATVSDAGSDVVGFRATFQQAHAVNRVRVSWQEHMPASTPRVVHYRDAGLEILLLQDDTLARTFVESELGALAATTSEARRLRETLEASFRFGSHVATAEHLQLHEHTVRNRLHRAEEVLGRSLGERRTELQVALRLVRLLGTVEDEDRAPD